MTETTTQSTELLTEEEYVKKQGVACPSCGSYHVEGGSFDYESHIIYQIVDCTDCGSSWTDVFKLSGYDNFQPVQSDHRI